MVSAHVGSSPRADRRRLLQLFIVLLLVIALTLSVILRSASSAVGPLRAQPVLQDMAQQQPDGDSAIAVIVQKQTQGDHLERLVAELGGHVTQDLSIINGFAAEIPRRAVARLAQADGVRWVSYDAPVERAACSQCIDTGSLLNAYIKAIGADRVWNESPYLQGQGVTVAVVDSGISNHNDTKSRVIQSVSFGGNRANAKDGFGHGTHVAGTIAGNGVVSDGRYMGVAPKVNLINVRVTDERGTGRTSDVVAGLGWVLANHDRYNIRVVNLSMNSSVAESYNTSPLDAALEILWFNRIVVVVSAGNNGKNGVLYPPANDPFVITVGAMDDRGTANKSDDILAPYSAYGVTEGGFAKPELVAPGSNIISDLTSNSALARAWPDHVADNARNYFRMSGTSMSSAVTAGAAALVIQSNPSLTPDQVKRRLMTTASRLGASGTGAGYLDVYSAVRNRSMASANTGIRVSRLLGSGRSPIAWDSLNWDSLNWDSLNWDSVNWGSLNWDSLNWDSDYWGR